MINRTALPESGLRSVAGRPARARLPFIVLGVCALALSTLGQGPAASAADSDSGQDGDSQTCSVPADHPNPIVEDTPGTFTLTIPDGVIRIRASVWGAGGGGGRGGDLEGGAGGGGGGYASTTLVVSPGMSFKYAVGKGGWAESRVSRAADGQASFFWLTDAKVHSVLEARGGDAAATDGTPGQGGGATTRNLDIVMQSVAHTGGSGASAQDTAGGGGGGSAGHGGPGGDATGQDGGYGGHGGQYFIHGAAGGDGGADDEAGGFPDDPGAGGGGSGRVLVADPLGQGSDVGAPGADGRARIVLCP